VLTRTGVYSGNSSRGRARASVYRYPQDASGSGLPARYAGREQLWRFQLGEPAVNAGVTVERRGGKVFPILLRGKDENEVAGPAGLGLDVGPIPFSTKRPNEAAGLWWAPAGTYYVAVDSETINDEGPYRLRFWVNDLDPPSVRLLDRVVPAGRSARLRFTIRDREAGVDPGTLVGYFGGTYPVGLRYNQRTGRATLDLAGVKPGRYVIGVFVADYAQSKDTLGVRPSSSNTTYVEFKFRVTRT
jgi:hypothetical protein